MRRYLGAALAAAVLIAACDLVAGVDDLKPKEAIKCRVPEDCGDPVPCREWECNEGTCVSFTAPAGASCYRGECDSEGNCLCPAVGCADGEECVYHTQCESGYCDAGACGPSPCGGPCEGICMECTEGSSGYECTPVVAGETLGGACEQGCDGEGFCPSCDDDIRNSEESDIDCGGASCPPCAEGMTCGGGADCQSCRCEDKRCAAPACDNGMQDGCESDVDCGGPCGSTCAPGEKCRAKQDCASHWCDGGVCREGE